MIYVIPVSLSDAHLIDPLCDVVEYLGGMKGRRVIVLSDPQASVHATHLKDRITQAGAKAEMHTFNANCDGGWPHACNRYFFMGVNYLTYHAKVNESYYWFELDNCPIKEGWIERIGSEWGTAVNTNKRFMGVLREYMGLNNQGHMVSHGLIMNGSAVYPANFGIISPLIRSIIKDKRPWDVFMRNEITGNPKNPNVHDISKFVTFNWGTDNYRRENGEIVCDQRPRPEGLITSDKTYPITEDTVLVHGDKSGTLARLIISEGKRTASTPEAPVAAPVAQAHARQGIIPQAPAPPEEVRSLMAELMKDDGELPEGVSVPIIVEQAPVPRSYTKAEKTKRKKKKTLKVRTAQSIRMKEIWAAKRAKTPITIVPIAA